MLEADPPVDSQGNWAEWGTVGGCVQPVLVPVSPLGQAVGMSVKE